MHRSGFPVYLVSTAVFILLLVILWREMPDRISAHFDEAGKATGRTPKSGFLFWNLGIGLGLPLTLLGVLYLTRHLPREWVNTPHPDYWRKPENHRRGCEVLFESGLWFSSSLVLWLCGLVAMVLATNREEPHEIDPTLLWLLTGFLMVSCLAWTGFLLWYFMRKPPGNPGARS